jgi:zinc protease
MMEEQMIPVSRILCRTAMTLFIPVFVMGMSGVSGAFDLPHEFHTLPNGLRVILAPDATVPTVSYYTLIDAGSRDETKKGTTGLAHVFEHMMFRGTERYPDFDAAVGPMGAQTNAGTGNDMTTYFVNAKSEFLKDIIDLEADRVQNLIFTDKIFRTELGPVKEERRRAVVESPYGYLETRLYDLAFEKHTYKHPVIGWEEDLEKLMTFQDGLKFKETYYAPRYVVISVAGNFNPDSALTWIAEKYGDWTAEGKATGTIPDEPVQTAPRTRELTWKDGMIAPMMMMAHKSPAMSFDNLDYAALQVTNRILFSNSGRLRQRLLVDQQLVEDIDGDAWGSKDPGLWTITTTIKDEASVAAVETIIIEELQKLRDNTAAQQELDKAIKGIKADRIFGLDRPSRAARTLGRFAILSGSPDNVMREMEMLDRVTPAVVQEFARKYLTEAGRTTVLLNPKLQS